MLSTYESCAQVVCELRQDGLCTYAGRDHEKTCGIGIFTCIIIFVVGGVNHT